MLQSVTDHSLRPVRSPMRTNLPLAERCSVASNLDGRPEAAPVLRIVPASLRDGVDALDVFGGKSFRDRCLRRLGDLLQPQAAASPRTLLKATGASRPSLRMGAYLSRMPTLRDGLRPPQEGFAGFEAALNGGPASRAPIGAWPFSTEATKVGRLDLLRHP